MKYLRYHSTNCYFLENPKKELLAVDAGWPDTLYEYARKMKEIGLKMDQIRWAIVTHFHMDHAGLITDFLAGGIDCIIFENQMESIGPMEKTIIKNYPKYQPIDQKKLLHWKTADAKEKLEEIGIGGAVAITDGHSPDGISFISNDHEAIIGDLAPEKYVLEDDGQSVESYRRLRSHGVKVCFPAHAPVFFLD